MTIVSAHASLSVPLHPLSISIIPNVQCICERGVRSVAIWNLWWMTSWLRWIRWSNGFIICTGPSQLFFRTFWGWLSYKPEDRCRALFTPKTNLEFSILLKKSKKFIVCTHFVRHDNNFCKFWSLNTILDYKRTTSHDLSVFKNIYTESFP